MQQNINQTSQMLYGDWTFVSDAHDYFQIGVFFAIFDNGCYWGIEWITKLRHGSHYSKIELCGLKNYNS